MVALPMLLMLLIGLAMMGFWLWMLIDALTRPEEVGEKILWVLVIVLLNFLGALIYYFIGRRSKA